MYNQQRGPSNCPTTMVSNRPQISCQCRMQNRASRPNSCATYINDLRTHCSHGGQNDIDHGHGQSAMDRALPMSMSLRMRANIHFSLRMQTMCCLNALLGDDVYALVAELIEPSAQDKPFAEQRGTFMLKWTFLTQYGDSQ